jgi:hypothetical protein
MGDLPDEDQLARYFSLLGKKGAKARNAKMSPQERKEIATRASKAAAEARTLNAKKKRRKT